MNGQTQMGLAAAAAAAVRPCRRRLLSSASAGATAMTATATPLFPRCPHPHHHPHGRRIPFLASAASQTSQSGPTTTPTPIPADPRAAVAGNLPFFDRVLFPDTLPLETPPIEEEAAPPVDEGLASAVAAREETETEREAWRLLRMAPVGIGACGVCSEALNYERRWSSGTWGFSLRSEAGFVRNLLLRTLQLQAFSPWSYTHIVMVDLGLIYVGSLYWPA